MTNVFFKQDPLSDVIHVPTKISESAKIAIDLIANEEYSPMNEIYKTIATSFASGETELPILQLWGNTQYYNLDRLKTHKNFCKETYLQYLVLGGDYAFQNREKLDQSVWDLMD